MHTKRALLLRVIVIVAMATALELLCRSGIITRFTMIPPTDMASESWASTKARSTMS